MSRPRKISPARAAKLLDVNVNTVKSWCRKAVAGEPSKLRNVERHPVNGYYFLDPDEVRKLGAKE